MKILPQKRKYNISRDYNRLHPGWSPNSAYNSAYSFADNNIGEFCTQYMAIIKYKLGSAEPF